MARVIGVFSGKGGSGKTTTAVNLGAILSKQYGRAVTLVDCNLTTSHVGLHLGMYNYHVSLNHVLRGEYDIEDAIYSHHSGMKVVPASVSVTDVRGVEPEKLSEVVKRLDSRNDFIILDASPGLGKEALSALNASQDVLYVTNPHLPSVVDVLRNQVIAADFKLKPIGIALNMVSKDKHEMKNSEIEYLTELPVIASIPYDRDVGKSLAMKAPVSLLNPNAPSSREFQRLAAQILGVPAPKNRKFLGFLRR